MPTTKRRCKTLSPEARRRCRLLVATSLLTMLPGQLVAGTSSIGAALSAVETFFAATAPQTQRKAGPVNKNNKYDYNITIGMSHFCDSSFIEPARDGIKRDTGVNVRHFEDEAMGGNYLSRLLQRDMHYCEAAIVKGDLDIQYLGTKYTPAQWKGFGLQQYLFARNPLYVVVPDDAPIRGLSREQLRDIFTGEDPYWEEKLVVKKKEVTRKWKVRVHMMASKPIARTLRRDLLGGKPFGENVTFHGNAYAQEDPGSFAQVANELRRGTVKAVTKDRESVTALTVIDSWVVNPARPVAGLLYLPLELGIDVPFVFVTKGEPTVAGLKLLDYFSGPGKEYLIPQKPAPAAH